MVGLEAQPLLFLNYRSSDTGMTASRLFDDLSRCVDPLQLFLDLERLEGGVAWPPALQEALQRTTLLVVLIGERWLTTYDAETCDRRLNLPDDWVRLEIETALQRGIDILPVLVDGALPPSPRAFRTIPSLQPLPSLQAVRLRRKDWTNDVNLIVALLKKHGFREALGMAKDARLRLVLDRVRPYRESRMGEGRSYGTIVLPDGSTAYGEGIDVQMTLVNDHAQMVVVPTIDVYIEKYDADETAVYNYDSIAVPAIHLEVPASRLPAVTLTDINITERLVPMTANRYALRPRGSPEAQHTLNCRVVAKERGRWKIRFVAMLETEDGKRQTTESEPVTIVKS